MNTKFTFYDKDNKLNNAELILSLEINNKKYIIYELEEEKISEYDIMHIGEYEEIDNLLCNETAAKVVVKDIVYAGTKIAFNDVSMVVKQDYRYCKFIKSGGDVRMAAL